MSLSLRSKRLGYLKRGKGGEPRNGRGGKTLSWGYKPPTKRHKFGLSEYLA